jgi:hypothetical protein
VLARAANLRAADVGGFAGHWLDQTDGALADRLR